jgi:hypothetical protein
MRGKRGGLAMRFVVAKNTPRFSTLFSVVVVRLAAFHVRNEGSSVFFWLPG